MGTTTCVLVIDDEPDIREIAKISLKITKQWDVLTAASGLEGLEAAVTSQPDLILLDVTMPDMDGFETLKQLRSHPMTEKIPVLLLTAAAKVVQQTEYVQVGAQGVLLKPFDPGALGDQIEVALKP
jgi:CheY-like chemotaxis protein